MYRKKVELEIVAFVIAVPVVELVWKSNVAMKAVVAAEGVIVEPVVTVPVALVAVVVAVVVVEVTVVVVKQ